MLTHALSITDGPCAIRYPKGAARQVPPDEVGSGLSARLLQRGDDVCILAVGKMVAAAEEAARVLEQQGVSATLWDVRLVKPLDPLMIADAATHPLLVTVEDGVREGGAGTAIADAVGATAGGRPSSPVVVLGVPDRYIAQAAPAAILATLGLDGPGIAASVIRAVEAAEAVTETR